MAGVFVLGSALLWVGSQLAFRLDIADFLPDEPAREGRLPPQVLRELSGGGRLAIVLESDEEIDTGDVERLFGYLVPRLAVLNGVRRVNARLGAAQMRFAQQHLPERIALYMEPGALVAAGERLSRAGIESALLQQGPASVGPPGERGRNEKDPLGLIRLASQPVRSWQGVSRVRVIDGFYALPGGRAFFLTVETASTLDDVRSARALVQSVEHVLEAARVDASIGSLLAKRQLYAVGRTVSYASAVETLRADGIRVAVAAALVVIVLLGVFFRRAAAPLAISLTVASGLLMTAAVVAVVSGSVSLLSWMFGGLIVGLGVDYGIHVSVHYFVYGSIGSGRTEALASALNRPGRGIMTGALTSAAGFVALVTIPYPWMRELAVLTALGLLAILVCSFTVLPLLLSFSRPAARTEAMWSLWGDLFERAGRGRPFVATAPWVVLLGAGLFALPSLRFEHHPWKLVVRGNPESARLDRLSLEAGSAFTPLLIVSTGSTAQEALQRDREAVRTLQPVALRAGIATMQSLAQWLPAPEDQRSNVGFVRENPELFSAQRFQRDFKAVVDLLESPDPYLTEEYLPRITGSLNPEIDELTLDDLRDLGLSEDVDRHLLRYAGEHVAITYVYLRQFPWAKGVVSNFVEVSRNAGLEDLPGVTLAGDPLRSADVRVIRRAVVLASLIAATLVGSILWLRFRRLSLVALCLAPLVCGLSAALLLMRLLGIELNLLSAAIAPILVGIGVDDGIHMVERLRGGQDMGTVLREAGSSMTMTTLTTVGAFACLSFATFTGIRELGLVGAVGLIVCLLASLLVIPMGWRLIDGRRVRLL